MMQRLENERFMSDGKAYFLKGRYLEASDIFKMHAEKGSAEAYEYLGLIYETGSGELSKDMSYAFHCFSKAADGGRVGGYEGLGRFYYFGWGTDRNFKLAFECYSKVAKAGYVTAPVCLMLGRMYQFGRGVHIDLTEARAYYKLAYEKGNVFGERFFGMLLADEGAYLTGWYHQIRALLRGIIIGIKNRNDIRLYLH